MIIFTCSCGKKYQLPDRTAGREVRCNQCFKTLVVPNSSQDEPVMPADTVNKETAESGQPAIEKQSEPVENETLTRPVRKVIPILSAAVILLILCGIGMFIAFKNITFKSEELKSHADTVIPQSGTENIPPDSGGLKPPVLIEKEEEPKKEEVKEESKKDKKSAVLDELGDILKGDKR